jgi:hypothetical protein
LAKYGLFVFVHREIPGREIEVVRVCPGLGDRELRIDDALDVVVGLETFVAAASKGFQHAAFGLSHEAIRPETQPEYSQRAISFVASQKLRQRSAIRGHDKFVSVYEADPEEFAAMVLETLSVGSALPAGGGIRTVLNCH